VIDWEREPDAQYDWIRAQTDPYPGAYTFLRGEQITVWDGEPVDVEVGDATPGEVVGVVPGAGVDVRTGDGAIRLTRLKPDDGVSRWADRYADERGLTPGTTFGRHHAPDDWQYTGIRGPETPTSFETNLTRGERGKLTVVAFGGAAYELTVSVTLDGEKIFETTATVASDYRETVGYSPTETGTHTVAVRFLVAGERIDTRYLKVFVHD
jgi:methionyl-tRNA formyltransferase